MACVCVNKITQQKFNQCAGSSHAWAAIIKVERNQIRIQLRPAAVIVDNKLLVSRQLLQFDTCKTDLFLLLFRDQRLNYISLKAFRYKSLESKVENRVNL